MKYIITESNLDKIVGKLLSSKKKLMPADAASKIIRIYLESNPDVSIESLIFERINNKNFIQIERKDRIYFVNSEGDEYAQIRYDTDDGWCFIYDELVDEISAFFSLEKSDSIDGIGRWVENTLQMRVNNTILTTFEPFTWLRIPS